MYKSIDMYPGFPTLKFRYLSTLDTIVSKHAIENPIKCRAVRNMEVAAVSYSRSNEYVAGIE